MLSKFCKGSNSSNMKWIKASETLPPPGKDNNLKIDDIPFSGRYWRANEDTVTKIAFQHFNVAGKSILDSSHFHRIFWLDESQSTLAIPEDVEKAAHAFASKPHYKDGTPLSISPMLYMKQGFIAGAKWKAANDPTHAPLPSNIVEQLRLANPYNENWGGLSGTREYEAWVKSVSKLRELLSSQPLQGNEIDKVRADFAVKLYDLPFFGWGPKGMRENPSSVPSDDVFVLRSSVANIIKSAKPQDKEVKP